VYSSNQEINKYPEAIGLRSQEAGKRAGGATIHFLPLPPAPAAQDNHVRYGLIECLGIWTGDATPGDC
jgi:hypothetical protein